MQFRLEISNSNGILQRIYLNKTTIIPNEFPETENLTENFRYRPFWY